MVFVGVPNMHQELINEFIGSLKDQIYDLLMQNKIKAHLTKLWSGISIKYPWSDVPFVIYFRASRATISHGWHDNINSINYDDPQFSQKIVDILCTK